MDRLFNTVSSNFVGLNGRAQLIGENSWVAASQFADASLDLVYIDGDQTYEGVCKDLAAWYPKVKKGGVICGDDIGWVGVKRAVDEFFGSRSGISNHYKKWFREYVRFLFHS